MDAPQRQRARKRAHPVQVRFVDAAADVATLEGIVQARPGDAIVTGIAGEQWPVADAEFADKYQPLPPLVMGEPGTYLSRPIDVLAEVLMAPFEVVLADGAGRLRGRPGDWLVDYGSGKLGVVDAAIFAATYDLLGPA